MEIKREKFGLAPRGEEVFLYTLTNETVMLRITNYGGIITELWTPDKNGIPDDIVLGFDKLSDYLSRHPYFGCLVGRYANRIARGRFALDGIEYQLVLNDNPNHLHGGFNGFDRVVWKAESETSSDNVSLKLNHLSVDGEEGYPGNLSVTVLYTLSRLNELRISYAATTDKPTILNLTQHSYFNLAGAGSGDILNHKMMIHADRYAVVDETLIPTGELRTVDGTPMDFRAPQTIGARLQDVPGGYDHTYVISRTGKGLSPGARVVEPKSCRAMQIWTTEPGIQFYSGNFLDRSMIGKRESTYQKHFGFCLETQHFPDSPNQPAFPSVVLRPGSTYRQLTIYRFAVEFSDDQ